MYNVSKEHTSAFISISSEDMPAIMLKEKLATLPSDANLLRIDGFTLTDEQVKLIAQVIEARPIKELEIENCQITDENMAALLAKCEAKSSLEVLGLHGTKLGKNGVEQLCALLPESNIWWLDIAKTGLEHPDLSAIAQSIACSPQLTTINAQFNPATDELGESYGDVLRAMLENPAIIGLKLQEYSSLVEAPTLPVEILELQQQILESLPPNLAYFEVNNGAYGEFGDVCADNRSKANQMIAWMEERGADGLTLAQRIEIEPRRPSICRYGLVVAQKTAVKEYEEFADRLPVLPAGETVTFDDLIQVNHEGYCALDNPRTWLVAPPIVDEVMDALSPEKLESYLTKKMDNGKTLLTYIVEVRGAAELAEMLIGRDVPLRSEYLVNADREPSSLLQAAIEANEVAAFFTPENWKGAHPAELRYVYEALPEEAKSQVANIHGLQCELQREARQSQKHAAQR